MTRRLVAICVFVLMARPALRAAECLPVSGERILVRDLESAVKAYGALDPNQPFGFAPLPGMRRIIRRQELAAFAMQNGFSLETIPASVCFERPVAPLNREQVQQALRASLNDPAISLELVDYSHYPLPQGRLEFPHSGLGFAPPGKPETPVPWLGRLAYDGKHHLTVWARVKLAVQREEPVASGPIPGGRPIAAGDVRIEQRAVFPFPLIEPVTREEIAGKMLRRTIASGQTITRDMLAEPPAVTRGETVAVKVQDGPMRLEFEARAESPGRIGDTIVLENLSSRQRFRGTIDGPHKVVVRPGGKS